MAILSNYLSAKIINHIFRTESFNKPSVLAIALCTSAIVDSDTGNLAGKEVAGVNYSRQVLNPSDTNWSLINNRQTKNLLDISFPVAGSNWGTITHIAILDNVSPNSGNLLFYGELEVPQTINTDDQAVLRTNGITFNISV